MNALKRCEVLTKNDTQKSSPCARQFRRLLQAAQATVGYGWLLARGEDGLPVSSKKSPGKAWRGPVSQTNKRVATGLLRP